MTNQMDIISAFPMNAKNVCLINNTVMFTSYNSVFNTEYLLSLPKPILLLTASNEFIFTLTENFLYQLDFEGNMVTELSIHKSCKSLSCNEDFIVLGYSNLIEIFYIPKCYKRVMYTLLTKIPTTSPLTYSHYFKNLMIMGFQDNLVKIFNLETGFTYTLGSFVTKLKGVYIEREVIYVVTADFIYFYKYEIINLEDNKQDFNKELKKKIPLERINYSCFDAKNSTLIVNCLVNEKHEIFLYSNFDTIGTLEENFEKVIGLSAHDKIILVQKEDVLILYDILKKVKTKTIDTPKILNFNSYKNHLFLAAENKILAISNNMEVLKRFDLDCRTRITTIHTTKNIIMTLSSLGTLRLYDIKDLNCFKKFDVPFQVTSTTFNDDLSLIFFANTSIFVFDTKRNKFIDEIKGHSGYIVKMIHLSGFLYSFGVDNIIRKQNVYDCNKEGDVMIDTEHKTILDFDILDEIFVLYEKEIKIFDKCFVFSKAISIYEKDKKIVYEKIKALNNNLVLIYGMYKEEFFLYFYNIEHGIKLQTLKLPKILDIRIITNTIYILGEDFLYAIGERSSKFQPIALNTQMSHEKIQEFIKNENYKMALIGSIQVNNQNLFNQIIDEIGENEIDSIMKIIPSSLVSDFKKKLNSSCNKNALWISKFILYYPHVNGQLQISEKAKKKFDVAKTNYSMLKALKRRKDFGVNN